jgi:hypothetical protein
VVTEAKPVERNAGLAIVIDTLIAPNDAYEKMRATPSWVWAYVIAFVLTAAGSLILEPAMKHAMQVGLPAQLSTLPSIARLPPAEQQAQIARIMSVQLAVASFSWLLAIVAIPFIVLLQSLVMLLANRIGGGDGTFRRFWSLGMNVAVPGGIGVLLLGIIDLIRGPESFTRVVDVTTGMPSLGMLVPGGPPFLTGLLSAITVIIAWQTILIGFGMIGAARISKPVAWSTAAVFLLTIALFGAWGAVQSNAG